MELDTVTTGIFALQGLFWMTCLLILIVLVFRRIQEKKEEDLDDYDN